MKTVLTLFATLTCAAPLTAQAVLPGSDLLQTPPGSFEDFATTPLPAGFFGPGSDPFAGSVRLMGEPLPGVPGAADTIVNRLTVASLPTCPSSATIPIEIVALSLTSTQPITVTFGGGTSLATYDVQVWLSSVVPQQQGQMQINRDHFEGGSFLSFLPVFAAFQFTKCSGTPGAPGVILDPAPPLNLATLGGPIGLPALWVYNDPGFGIISSPGGLVDHDCDPATPPVPYPPTSNFIPGIGFSPPPTCTAPGGPPFKELTLEQEMLAEHGVLPNCPLPGTPFCFGDGAGTPCPCGNNSPVGSDSGCQHSFSGVGGNGGRLRATGTNSVGEDTLCINGTVLQAKDLPPSAPVLFFQGTATIGGGLGAAFGDGLRCVGGTVIRLGTKFAFCGKAYYGCPLGDIPVAVRGALPAVGGLRHYQAWFRNVAPYCMPQSFNLTNGYSIPWVP